MKDALREALGTFLLMAVIAAALIIGWAWFGPSAASAAGGCGGG